MNEFVTSSTEPGYLTSLALTSAPFSRDSEHISFFSSEQIEQRRNLVLHLIRASDKVALLFGPEGVGKSTLLSQLQDDLADEVRVFRINALAESDSETCLIQFLRSLGVDDNEIRLSTNHTELLRQRCLRLQNLMIKPVLFIDDADQLSDEVLTVLVSWLAWQDEGHFLIQAIFTANNAMPELNTLHGRIQRVDLPEIAETELSAYLYHRLTSVGFQGELPFKPKVLSHIYKRSSGNPALINQLAHQALLGIKPASTAASRFVFWLKWLAVILVVVLLALALLFQDEINTLFLVTKQQPVLDQVAEITPETEVTTVNVDDKSLESELLTLSQADNTLTDINTNNANNSEEQARKELERLLAELPVPEQHEVDKKHAKMKPDLNTSDEQGETATLLPEPSKKQEKPYHQKAWILQQAGDHYTFQLMGSWEEKSVLEYMKKYKLEGDVAIFKSKRNGKAWYALIYGTFTSKEEARQASESWPVSLKQLPKWLRTFESIQQQIQK